MIENTAGTFPIRQVSLTPGERAAQASMLDVDFSEQTDVGKVRRTERGLARARGSGQSGASAFAWLVVRAGGWSGWT